MLNRADHPRQAPWTPSLGCSETAFQCLTCWGESCKSDELIIKVVGAFSQINRFRIGSLQGSLTFAGQIGEEL